MRYKIIVEYDGTKYVGWQKQKDQPNKSIEEILEKAIFQLAQENVKLNCAGRTDAGVHALAQVADFELKKQFEPYSVTMGLNAHLRDSDIVVVLCEVVSDDFHSRFDTIMRHYRYAIINRRSPLALQKNRAWHVPLPLDDIAMQLAANYLLGEHDFSAFRDAECQASSAVRVIKDLKISKDGQEIFIDISAKSFLHHMVRNIVGTLVWVGSQRIQIDEMLIILESRNRKLSGPNAPACGLYFLGANYN